MSSAANHPGYGNAGMAGSPMGGSPMGGSPMGGSPWGAGAAPGPGGKWGHPDGTVWYWHSRYASRPLWIIATVLGFIFWWPVGLILLFCTFGGRRMSCWGYGRHDGGYEAGWQGGPPPWVAWKRQWKRQMREWYRGQAQGPSPAQSYPSSGNRAFDEYRAETLRRLEEEQKEFGAFLDRLRFAKDKAEFDQFMAELRSRPPAPPTDQPGPAPA
ncbi:MAG TPA: DUF2852 domain-containing protein [Acetobacteraceae bacterium]|nr:DUF2852 domain-containing protein [Acetobacteraceae bacterium]